MRYKVRFNSKDMMFVVVDAYQVDNPIASFPTLEKAHARALWEERRWYKCSPEDEADAWPKDLAAV